MKKYTIEIGRNVKLLPSFNPNNNSKRLGIICVNGKFFEKEDYSITQYHRHVIDFFLPTNVPFPPTSGRTTFTWSQVAILIQDLRAHDTGYDSIKKIVTILKSVKSNDIVIIDNIEEKSTIIVAALKNFKLIPHIDFSINSITNIIGNIDINGKIFEPHEYTITGYTHENISNANDIIESIIGRETNLILYHDIPPLIDIAIDEYYQEKFKRGEKNQEVLDELINFIFQLQFVKTEGAILITHK